MKIIDVITYNGEADILEIRLNLLKGKVDQFVIVEFDKTFTGQDKPSYFKEQEASFRAITGNISYFMISEDIYGEYKEMAENSPNTIGAEHWKREFMQKESIQNALVGMSLDDNDLVFIGDADEIWEWSPLAPKINSVNKLKLRVYSYWLNNRSSELFWGTIVGKYRHIKGRCLNHMRSKRNFRSHDYWGWHFTSMGGVDAVRRKLENSYTAESYYTPTVRDKLKENIQENRDFLGREFTYALDESEWPQYLKDNRHRYLHLLRNK